MAAISLHIFVQMPRAQHCVAPGRGILSFSVHTSTASIDHLYTPQRPQYGVQKAVIIVESGQDVWTCWFPLRFGVVATATSEGRPGKQTRSIH